MEQNKEAQHQKANARRIDKKPKIGNICLIDYPLPKGKSASLTSRKIGPFVIDTIQGHKIGVIPLGGRTKYYVNINKIIILKTGFDQSFDHWSRLEENLIKLRNNTMESAILDDLIEEQEEMEESQADAVENNHRMPDYKCDKPTETPSKCKEINDTIEQYQNNLENQNEDLRPEEQPDFIQKDPYLNVPMDPVKTGTRPKRPIRLKQQVNKSKLTKGQRMDKNENQQRESSDTITPLVRRSQRHRKVFNPYEKDYIC